MEISNCSWKGVVMSVYQTLNLLLQLIALFILLFK